MGLFDEVKCLYPLPWPEAQELIWQTKDTDAQYLHQYEIRADGTLWHEDHTIRVEDDKASPLGIVMHRDNKHWVQVNYTGELEIYTSIESRTAPKRWYDVQFWFRDGVVKDAVFHFEEDAGP